MISGANCRHHDRLLEGPEDGFPDDYSSKAIVTYNEKIYVMGVGVGVPGDPVAVGDGVSKVPVGVRVNSNG